MKSIAMGFVAGVVTGIVVIVPLLREPRDSRGPEAARAMKRWVDSFEDKSAAQIREKLAPVKPIVGTWQFEGKPQLTLEYEFHDFSCEFYMQSGGPILVSLNMTPGES